MNIRPTLKITLFTLISAAISMCAYLLTDILVIALIAEAFLFCAYFSFVLWLCCAMHKKFVLSGNLISILIPFSIALYAGVRKYAFTEASDINIIQTWTLNDLFFFAASIVTLLCVLILVGRIIFGSPFKSAPQEPVVVEETVVEEPAVEEPVASDENCWVCECGQKNSSKFCSECGKPAVSTAKAETATTENAD